MSADAPPLQAPGHASAAEQSYVSEPVIWEVWEWGDDQHVAEDLAALERDVNEPAMDEPGSLALSSPAFNIGLAVARTYVPAPFAVQTWAQRCKDAPLPPRRPRVIEPAQYDGGASYDPASTGTVEPAQKPGDVSWETWHSHQYAAYCAERGQGAPLPEPETEPEQLVLPEAELEHEHLVLQPSPGPGDATVAAPRAVWLDKPWLLDPQALAKLAPGKFAHVGSPRIDPPHAARASPRSQGLH